MHRRVCARRSRTRDARVTRHRSRGTRFLAPQTLTNAAQHQPRFGGARCRWRKAPGMTVTNVGPTAAFRTPEMRSVATLLKGRYDDSDSVMVQVAPGAKTNDVTQVVGTKMLYSPGASVIEVI